MKEIQLAVLLCVLTQIQVDIAKAETYIGYYADNESVVVSGSGSSWYTNDTVIIGLQGNNNRLSILNGAASDLGRVIVGLSDWSNYYGNGVPANSNIVEVSGAGSFLNASVSVGYGPSSDHNELRITAGGRVISNSGGEIGRYSDVGGENRVIVEGTDSSWHVSGSGASGRALTVGYRSSGQSMIISDGASVQSSDAVLGYHTVIYSANNNQVTVIGPGSEWVSGGLTIGAESSGNSVDILDGGTLVSTSIQIANYSGDENNSLTVSGNGSKIIVDNINAGYATSFSEGNSINIESGGEMIINNEIVLNLPQTEAGGEIPTTPCYLELRNGGTLRMKNDFDASQYGFNFNSGGTLIVEGQLTGLSMVDNDRRLEAADVLGDLAVEGIFAPGTSPADSTLNGLLVMGANGVLEMEIGGRTLGDEYDRLTVIDSAELDGTLEIVLLDGFSPAYGDVFDLFNWEGGVTGAFSVTNTPALPSDLYWDTSSLYTTGQITVIPEPASVMLMTFVGLCGFVVRRRFPGV